MQLRNFFIPKIIVDFRTDLHKMKINTGRVMLQKIRFFDKKDLDDKNSNLFI